MLPLPHKIAFLLFTLITLPIGLRGFYRLFKRIRRGRADVDRRTDHRFRRLRYALATTLSQRRTFRKRPFVSCFHSFIFYGFVFYILVNFIDAMEGYLPFTITSTTAAGAAYNLVADILSLLVLVGVVALVLRRFLLPSRRDFRFNASTLLHPNVKQGRIALDSLIVSAFILFHVGSRAVGAGARLAAEGPDPFQPFANALSHLFTPRSVESWRIFGYWGALGSVLLFLAYFPFTKHVHIFMAPLKYFFARTPNSGALPPADIDLENEDQQVGAKHLDDLAWPRLLDAYACIQCNRCQDVCPATATGKSLSPAALEINKRMELNSASTQAELLLTVISPEAVWACTTCGACMEVCPVQDEQMLDIIDIRRNLVMIDGEFPSPLQTAFRGMERAKNPWGINHDQRSAWAEGLSVPTTDDNPDPDVLYWVGCAASYDPQAQKTARALVQLLTYAEVNYAVLGKKECCTGDTARRAGNEYLYRQLADQNVSTLNTLKPKLVVASCPHCMNSLGNEYKQIGGDYKVVHHTEYLESLVQAGRLESARLDVSITYHDPCYLGRHNGVYDAPRNLLRVLGSEVIELERNRENAFCCGAGGAQFWKEEEHGSERISENRFKEVQRTLSTATDTKTLAVGCPFCKSMLGSTPSIDSGDAIAIRDVAELLLEAVQKKRGISAAVPAEMPASVPVQAAVVTAPAEAESREIQATVNPIQTTVDSSLVVATAATLEPESAPVRKKWSPKVAAAASPEVSRVEVGAVEVSPVIEARAETAQPVEEPDVSATSLVPPKEDTNVGAPERRKWQPKRKPSE